MKDILLTQIRNCIKGWQKDDIYAISLFVYDEDDNPSKPTVTLGYNTFSNLKEEEGNACDLSEAKWNYAFWLQNEELVFGTGKTAKTVREWILSNGFLYIPDADIYGKDEAKAQELEKITQTFIKLLVDVVKELHSSGFIKEQFGQEIPVLIHELEYYDEIARQNIEANGFDLVADFVKFCCS